MCYSLRTSLLALTLGMTAAFVAMYLGQMALGLFIFCYAFMQISEAFIWYGIDNNNVYYNKVGTAIGKYTLPAHNIGLGLGILASVYFMQKRNLVPRDFIPLFLGVLFYLYILFFEYSKDLPDVTYPRDVSCAGKDRRCQNGNNRLEWKYANGWYTYSILLTIFIVFAYITPTSSKIAIPSMYIMSLIGVYYYMEGSQALGSAWCVSTAMIAPIVVILNTYLTRNSDFTKILT